MNHGSREARGASRRFKSKALIVFTFAGKAPDPRTIITEWTNHRERNFQTVRLCECVGHGDTDGNDGVRLLIFEAKYGPVGGNGKTDYTRKADKIAELVGARGAGIVPGTWERWEVTGQ